MSIKKFIENVISPNRDKSQPNHLLMNMEKVQIIEPKPFVSIHVALYNEKRVVERLIRACTSQNWFVDSLQLNAVSGKQFANYEVIIADDSNDETTEIAKKTLLDGGWTIQVPGTGYQVPEIGKQESETRNLEPELEYFIFTKTNAPTVKLIHRFSRSGYKGAALHKALERSSGRAWYIVVMDADFVPYPDTVEQFVKTFQVLNADGLQQTADSNEQLAVSGKRSAVSNIVAVQGYQWHVLNKSQTWVTRGVRTEYAGSYVIERSSEQIYGGLKQIAGSVYAIRADVLRKFGWGTSITEDFELTLRLYEAGYKVLFTPYIQAPAEAVATVKRLIRQRMRWAEGSSYNVKVMFPRIMKSPNMTLSEKMEFIYFAFYYLQAAFFVVGTFAWFISEALMGARLPFWTAAFGWSLVFTNLFALPLMNIVGLFLEESDERDYAGIVSFILISYIVVPFQAYAAIKGFLEPHEGPWFRTPKSGIVTDVAERTGFGKFFGRLVGGSPIPPFDAQGKPISADYADSAKSAFNQLNPRTFAFASAYRPLVGREIEGRRRHFRFVSKSVLAGLLTVVILLNYLAFFVPNASAAAGSRKVEQQINIVDEEAAAGTAPVGIVCVDTSKFSGGTYYFEVVATNSAGSDQTVTFSKGGNGGSPACGSGSADTSTTITITASTTTATRFRTSAIGSYPTGEVFVSSVGANVAVRAARVIILQSATSFTNTQTQIEVGDQNTKTDTSYIVLDDQKDYCFDTTATSTTCSAASSSLWSPAPTVYFEATISNSNAGSTAYAVLAFSSCSTLIDSEVSTTNSTYTRVRSNSFTPTAGRNYFVCIKASANTAKIANAKIILEQSSASGVSKLETTQVYNNTYIQTTDTSYARINYNNLFDPANFTPRTVSYYFEIYGDSDFLDAWIKVKDETTPADITNGEINIPGASTDARRRSSALSMPTTSKTLDVEHKALTGNTAKTNVAWLVIQIDMTLSLEQQINMIDQEYTTASTTLAPTDYSLGIIHWDDDKFSNISTVTFEALICNTGYTSGKDQIAVTTTATLMEITSSPDVEVASVTYLINNCGYALQTVDVTADAQFLDDKDYTVQIKTDNASGTAQIKAARLKVVQSSGGWITDTQTQVEVGNNQTAFTNTTYSALTHYKIYQYNDSVFTPSPVTSPGDVEFQATLKIASAGDTVHAELYNNTNSTSVAEVSHTGDTTWTLKTGTNVDGDADWDTTNDDNYIVRVKCTDGNGGGCSGSISNAKIVLNQSDGTNGVTDLETVQQYANSNVSCACAGIYGDDVYDNTFVPANFGGTKAYFFESTIKTSAGTGYSRLKNDTDSSAITGSEVSTASTTYVRQRSGDITANMPASSKRMDSQKNVTSPNTVNLASAWLIIQISSMPVPEALLFAAPALIFVPKLVEWIKQRRLKNKEKIVMVLPV